MLIHKTKTKRFPTRLRLHPELSPWFHRIDWKWKLLSLSRGTPSRSEPFTPLSCPDFRIAIPLLSSVALSRRTEVYESEVCTAETKNAREVATNLRSLRARGPSYAALASTASLRLVRPASRVVEHCCWRQTAAFPVCRAINMSHWWAQKVSMEKKAIKVNAKLVFKKCKF